MTQIEFDFDLSHPFKTEPEPETKNPAEEFFDTPTDKPAHNKDQTEFEFAGTFK
jgi:hypothetical protein